MVKRVMTALEQKIIPAIIAKTQEELDATLTKVFPYVSCVQLDVMDNQFVPNTSLWFDINLPKTSVCYEAHLMVAHPLQWIRKHGDKVDVILVHFESTNDHAQIIQEVKTRGKRVGFVLNPETPLSVLFDFLDELDQVLIMTVNPGFYGSPFLPEMMNKIVELRQQKPQLNIEVDGGITDQTIELVKKAGANLFVSGSFVVKADDVQQAVNTLLKKIT